LPDVVERVQDAARRWEVERGFGGVVAVAQREHRGAGRASQNRNNGFRALGSLVDLADDDAILVLDGDIVPSPRTLDAHRRLLAGGAEVVYGGRANLSEEEAGDAEWDTMPVDPAAGEAWFRTVWPGREDALLAARAQRYGRALAMRRVGLHRFGVVKAHKPKVLSCHFSCSWRVVRAVNGFDEAFEGWGWEDDDFGRRVLGVVPAARLAVGIEVAPAMHVWHPSRARDVMERTENLSRFRDGVRRGRVRAELGLDSPREQGAVDVRVVSREAG
jgi:GT2 family glycosyltransferase